VALVPPALCALQPEAAVHLDIGVQRVLSSATSVQPDTIATPREPTLSRLAQQVDMQNREQRRAPIALQGTIAKQKRAPQYNARKVTTLLAVRRRVPSARLGRIVHPRAPLQ
jgi:hypothetical protein